MKLGYPWPFIYCRQGDGYQLMTERIAGTRLNTRFTSTSLLDTVTASADARSQVLRLLTRTRTPDCLTKKTILGCPRSNSIEKLDIKVA